jgi:hypothetical protein
MFVTAQYPQCCAFERIVDPALRQIRLTRVQSQLVRLLQESAAVRMPDDGTEKTASILLLPHRRQVVRKTKMTDTTEN